MLSILLPRLCTACRKPLKKWEKCLCINCLAELPLTGFHEDPGNPLAEVFWGRVSLEQAIAWFYFRKGSAYQDVLHKLKYDDRPDIGEWLGLEFGYHLKNSRVFVRPDCIIPVPLHPKKLRRRGYNQSAEIAKGLSKALGAELVTKNLIRSTYTATQTRKTRFDRYLNVTGKFAVKDAARLQNRHILLVDDVVTTGATLEACAETLLTVPGMRVSVAAVAWAKD